MAAINLRTILLLGSAAVLLLGRLAATGAASKPVLAHYMPWYVAKPYSSSWGWHWTMNHYNPDSVGADGKRAIASWYYPLIGPYDSADPVVLEYHVLLMKLAGIDGVMVDWYGMDNYLDYGVNNQRTLALLNWTQKAGLRFCLCYEDSTIQQEINGGFITPATAVAHAQQTLLYAETNFLSAPGYLRWTNKPVLLNFGPQYFKNSSDWQTIFSVLKATNQPAFFTIDNRLAVGAGAFDWPPMWMSQSSGGVLSVAQLESYLVSFEQKALSSGWPAYISGGFPRFRDIYQQAGVGSSYGYLDDRGGDTLRETLSRALTNSAAMVQLVTWNDFGEGTIIEPTLEYGFRDLGIVQDFRRQYLDAGFALHTNDLALASRLYNLRRLYATNTVAKVELDRAFTNVVTGDLPLANTRLTALECARPVIYSLGLTGSQLGFTVGGYLSAAGVQVQVSSNGSPDSWQTISTLPVSASAPRFATNVSPEGGSVFFRARNAGL